MLTLHGAVDCSETEDLVLDVGGCPCNIHVIVTGVWVIMADWCFLHAVCPCRKDLQKSTEEVNILKQCKEHFPNVKNTKERQESTHGNCQMTSYYIELL